MVADSARLTAALADRYRIERELGGGGMSRVFLAREVGLNREVVIKVLSADVAAGVSLERFEREIQLAYRRAGGRQRHLWRHHRRESAKRDQR